MIDLLNNLLIIAIGFIITNYYYKTLLVELDDN